MRSVKIGCVVAGLLALWGCSKAPQNFVSKPEPWRGDEETVCLQSGYVRSSPYLVSRAALGGPGHCGALRPFEMSAAVNGQVSLRPAALLRCPMVPAVEHWVQTFVMPAARRNFGIPIVEVKVAASYGCRPMNNVSGAKLSEHGHANALDVSAFILLDGRQVTVKKGWNGDPRERAFLRQVHQGACDTFTTVLGPNADANHHDHFHMDLARHGRNGEIRICR
ncbi:MAG: extensin family protein [Hyphomicrobiaceae bacterium]